MKDIYSAQLNPRQVIEWFTTPQQLRELADAMEALWRLNAPGQSKVVATLYGRKNADLVVIVDQENIRTPGWFERLNQGWSSKEKLEDCPTCGKSLHGSEYDGQFCRRCEGKESTPMNDEPLMQFFKYEHLPEHLQAISKPFGDLAKQIVDTLPKNPERTTALRKLLESKDCAVRAKLFQNA